MERVLVLYNPISGQGRGAAAAEGLTRACAGLGLKTLVRQLEGPGTAGRILGEHEGAFDRVAAVGGDGTVNDVAGAMYGLELKSPLGLVPLGLSNCLARHFGLPWDPEGAAVVLARGRVVGLDLADLGRGRVAAAFLGAGLDAAVVAEVARGRSGPVSNLTYLRRLGRLALDSGNWPRITVEVDGRALPGTYYQAVLTPISNYARFFSMRPGPGFKLYLLRGSGPAAVVRSVIRSGSGRSLDRAADLAVPVREKAAFYGRSGRAFYQFDGEAGGELPVEAEIKQGALNFLAP